MKLWFSWLMVLATVLLTTYGQLMLKWQVGVVKKPMFAWLERCPELVQWLFRPWVISALAAAFLASMCWMLAISKLDMSKAYPFMALNFLMVVFLAVPLFGETLNTAKIAGLVMIVVGLLILSQG